MYGGIPNTYNPNEVVANTPKSILLTKAEVQSGCSRQKHAEGLILQLPKDHDGRNTWLLNYGVSDEAKTLRARHHREIKWDDKRNAAHPVNA